MLTTSETHLLQFHLVYDNLMERTEMVYTTKQIHVHVCTWYACAYVHVCACVRVQMHVGLHDTGIHAYTCVCMCMCGILVSVCTCACACVYVVHVCVLV